MFERFVFDGETERGSGVGPSVSLRIPAWQTLERELRRDTHVRWRIKVGERKGGIVRKRLIDEDRPHWPKAHLAFHAQAIEVSASWPVLDQVLPAFARLGGRRVAAAELAREQPGRIDYFSRYDDASGGLRLRTPDDTVDTFLLWNGFAGGLGERLGAVSLPAALAWERACDPSTPARERAEVMWAVYDGGMKSLPSVRGRAEDRDSFRQHEDACIDDLAAWLTAHQRRRAEVTVEDL